MGSVLVMEVEAGLTCRHDGDLSGDDALHSQAEQSSSHQAAGEGQILQTDRLSASPSHTLNTQKPERPANICTVVPSGPDPDTVSLLTVGSVVETCCPGGRRCPETSTTPSELFRDDD